MSHPVTHRMVLGYVLTETNIALLKAGKPIHFNAEDFGLPEVTMNEVYIMYYKDDDEALKDLTEKGYISKNTEIRTLPKRIEH